MIALLVAYYTPPPWRGRESDVPGLPEFEPGLPDEERLSQAVESNVLWTMHTILKSPEGQARLAEGRMKLVGAVYEITSGRVRILS